MRLCLASSYQVLIAGGKGMHLLFQEEIETDVMRAGHADWVMGGFPRRTKRDL